MLHCFVNRNWQEVFVFFWGVGGEIFWKRLFLRVLGGLLGHIKAKVLEMSASSGAYS